MERTGAPSGAWYAMVVLHYFLHVGEEESTSGAASFLSLEQGCPALRHFWMPPQSACPVQHISIKETGVSPDLLMPPDECVIVLAQPHTVRLPEVPVAHPIGEPVASGYPMAILMGMTAPAPPMQLVVEQVVHPAEHLLGYHRGIEVAPSSDDTIQVRDEFLLGRRAVATHDYLEILEVLFLGVLAWLDEDLETDPVMAVVTGAMTPCLDLTDREPEEVESDRHPQIGVEGVADSSL